MDRDQYLGLVAAGWVLTFTVPIGGLVIACILSDRRDGHSLAMGVVSILIMAATMFGVLVLTS